MSPPLAVLGATLVDTSGASPVEDSVLLIRDGRIEKSGPRSQVLVPQGVETLDVSGSWIVPGLIDSHIHFFQSGGLYTRPDILDLRDRVPYREKEALEARAAVPEVLARYLRCGITSVVDVGGPFWNFEVREHSRSAPEMEAAARVAVAGPLISTWQPPALETDDPPILKAASPQEGRAMVRRQAEFKPDLIKIWYIVAPGQDPRVHLPLVTAVIEESHALGLRVAVHATQRETARVSVQAGADVLVHSVDDQVVDPEFISLLKARNIPYTTTLMVTERYKRTFAKALNLTRQEHAHGDPKALSTLFDVCCLPPEAIPKRFLDRIAQEGLPPSAASLENLRILQAAGVCIAAGTDAGNIGTPHGPALHYELGLMQDAGLTPIQVLQAATLGSARVMGRERELGSLEGGKLADFLVLDADPLSDIRNVSRIRRVFKGGHGFDPARILPDSPEDVVQRQLNAYNARDLSAFLDTYAPGVKLYQHPDVLQMEGLAPMRERYGRLFREAPDLHAAILHRSVLGRFVVDRERATGMPGGRTGEVVVVYEVLDGKITRGWFIRE